MWASEGNDAPFEGFRPALEPAEVAVKPPDGHHQGVRKRPHQNVNMSSILKSLLGEGVVVELKNDSGMCSDYLHYISYAEVKGILDEVDAWMNLTLVQATQTTALGESCDLDIAFVKGVTIRYVHISEKINMRTHVTSYLRRIKSIASNNAPRMIKR